MDFSKESTKDLPTHGYDASLPTCWILEGLVMYLKKDDVVKLLEEITGLSVKGSYMILNYLNSPIGDASNIDHMSELLKQKGWTEEKVTCFGNADFNFGRFPADKEPVTAMGFGFYKLN